MNRSVATMIVGVAGALLSASASASLTVQGSGGAAFQAFPAALNNYADATRPYWDQASKDSGNRNVGNYLNNTWTGGLPGGSAPSPNITPVWWGNASNPDFYASMDAAIRFEMALPSNQVGAVLQLELSAYQNQNIIGWYDTNDAFGSEVLNIVHNGPGSPVASQVFTPAASFGLFIQTGGGHIFFSEAARNRSIGGVALTADDLATQHFAVFGSDLTSGNEFYYVGTEDLARSQAGVEIVGDYNDSIFTLRAIPTPGALSVLAMGGLIAGRRRR